MLNHVFHPEIYQGYNKNQPYFEGWYFKHVSADLSNFLIAIPGISLSKDDTHAFVQIITGKPFKSYYCRYNISSFIYQKDSFDISISDNHFSQKGITLNLEEDNIRLQAAIQYGAIQQLPKSVFSPNIMGFFGYLNFLDCYHGLISLNHSLTGHMTLNQTTYRFDNGKGYMEKDWGSSFPKKYVWLQCNHFDQDVSLFASIADVPFHNKSFIGLIAVLSIDKKQYRFATYNHSKYTFTRISNQKIHIQIYNKRHRLEIHAVYEDGNVLKAPNGKSMDGEISETLVAHISVDFWHRNNHILSANSRSGALEIVNFD